MDKRRRRYVMHDVYFLDDPLGCAIYDNFGAAGVAIWMGFIAACKKNHIEGEMSYTTDAEALAVLGLPGLELHRPGGGEPFTLEDFWSLLGDHKVTRRRRSGRRLHVISTRWTEWQVNPRKPKADTQNSTSDGTNTDTTSDESGEDSALETETERETETSSSSGSFTAETEAAPKAEEEDDSRLSECWVLLAKHDAEKFTAEGGVIRSKNWFVTAADTRRMSHEARAVELLADHPAWTAEDLAQHILQPVQAVEPVAEAFRAQVRRNEKRAAGAVDCDRCDDRGVYFDEETDAAVECECKWKAAS